ncbi:hypothetical protein IU433_19395 [Nocardia puris]|uniref:Signal transduction histidine kinase n=1 Tax=Nocardia puris TaxID=208602 RepID=A0A366E2M7_9NOCA|nr:hypothetical protein [Nocardia puris]MBF6212611.1 hypothetical protein [Nocardia puris]MBF6369191.1 hypothetical protein [Nocardia puris]MBF6461200.1 hypothetical protein [Nocardia puris]RBO96572.1 hypothetical protein DFR74_101587 [Nocardia puris]
MGDADSEVGLRDLLGLRDAAAWLFLLILEVTIVMYMARTFYDGAPLNAAIAVGLLVVAGVLVLVVPVDPLPWPATVFVMAAGPAATALTTTRIDADWTKPLWSAFASSYVLAVLVLRGRLGAAWVGMAGVAAVVAGVGMTAGVAGRVLLGTMVPIATVAGVSVCAAIMRPTQRSLRLLREEATMRAAAEATMAAENGERDRQLARLDKVARPILERIADGAELTSAEREQCRLLEAELRDGLRAPQLVTDELSAAARGARSRGVEVVLLDDGGFAGVPRWVRQNVIDAATKELDAANAGSVTVRVLPMGRRIVATVLANAPDLDRRTEIDTAGTVSVA